MLFRFPPATDALGLSAGDAVAGEEELMFRASLLAVLAPTELTEGCLRTLGAGALPLGFLAVWATAPFDEGRLIAGISFGNS